MSQGMRIHGGGRPRRPGSRPTWGRLPTRGAPQGSAAEFLRSFDVVQSEANVAGSTIGPRRREAHPTNTVARHIERTPRPANRTRPGAIPALAPLVRRFLEALGWAQSSVGGARPTVEGARPTVEGAGQRAEGRGQRAEGRGQRSKVRGQRSKGRGQRSKGRGQRSKGRGQRADGRGQRAEVRGQRAEGRGQRSKGAINDWISATFGRKGAVVDWMSSAMHCPCLSLKKWGPWGPFQSSFWRHRPSAYSMRGKPSIRDRPPAASTGVLYRGRRARCSPGRLQIGCDHPNDDGEGGRDRVYRGYR